MYLPYWSLRGLLPRDPSHQPPPSPAAKTCLHTAAVWVQLYKLEELPRFKNFLFKRGLGKKGNKILLSFKS